MPKFSDCPPPESHGRSFPVRRTPTGTPLSAVCLSENLVGTKTHYWGGRTTPCEDDRCEACQHGIAWRWHGYFIARDTTMGLLFLYEFTAAAAEAFIEYRHQHGTLRGCEFKARRHNGQPNGQVLISCRPTDLDHRFLHAPPDTIEILSRLWNLRPTGIAYTPQEQKGGEPSEPLTPPGAA